MYKALIAACKQQQSQKRHTNKMWVKQNNLEI